MKDEGSPLVDPLVAVQTQQMPLRRANTLACAAEDSTSRLRKIKEVIPTHALVAAKATDPGMHNFSHDPEMLYAASPKDTSRRTRSMDRTEYRTYNGTIIDGLRAILYKELRHSTIFSNPRIALILLGHMVIAVSLCVVFYFVPLDRVIAAEFLPGIKDFADLCVTGAMDAQLEVELLSCDDACFRARCFVVGPFHARQVLFSCWVATSRRCSHDGGASGPSVSARYTCRA